MKQPRPKFREGEMVLRDGGELAKVSEVIFMYNVGGITLNTADLVEENELTKLRPVKQRQSRTKSR